MKKLSSLLLVATLLLSLQDLHAQATFTMQPDSCVGKDAHVLYIPKQPTSINGNYASLNELVAGTWTFQGDSGTLRIFIDFKDLDLIPQGSTITSAVLTMFGPASSNTITQGNMGDNKCWIQRITSAWSENTLTWANQPSVTTTNQTALAASTSTWNYNAITTVTQLVQNMVSLPVSQRHGFCIRLQTEIAYRSMIFASSDASNAALHPRLVVSFTSPCSTTDTTRSIKENNAPTSVMMTSTTASVHPGQLYHSDAVNPANMQNGLKMDISPNPANNFINIKYDLPFTGTTYIKLIAEDGRLIKTITVDGTKGSHAQQAILDKKTIGNVSSVNIQLVQGAAYINKRVIVSN